MMIAAKILIAIALVFTALSIACAVRIGRRPHRPAADPQFYPYGDMPGFSREQIEAIARRPVEAHHQRTILFGTGTKAVRSAFGRRIH